MLLFTLVNILRKEGIKLLDKRKIVGILSLGFLAVSVNELSMPTLAFADESTTGNVMFNGGGVNMETTLPAQLNFGTTVISYTNDTNLVATIDGNQSSSATTGIIRVNDTRGTNVGWKMKVNQTQFKSGTDELTGAQLSLVTGNPTNIGGTVPTGGAINQKVTLDPGVDFEIFKANTNEGNGISELEINQFNLMVPASTSKKAGQYTTTITWTISDTI